MKMIASREFAVRPGAVWQTLAREGVVVITKDGVPRGIILPTNDATFVEDLQELVFARARRAVRALRERAAQDGLDRLTSKDIDREIRAVRQARSRALRENMGS